MMNDDTSQKGDTTMETHRKVMVVDDEPDVRAEIAEYLTDEGYEVIEAENGLDALIKFDAIPCDIVVTDMKMPNVSGQELAWRLHHMAPDVPIIAITGHHTSNELYMMQWLGFTAGLEKPFGAGELAEIIKSLLQPDEAVH